ncbi:hypothetical protein V6N13_052121 [Hibiscus sabdariffa]
MTMRWLRPESTFCIKKNRQGGATIQYLELQDGSCIKTNELVRTDHKIGETLVYSYRLAIYHFSAYIKREASCKKMKSSWRVFPDNFPEKMAMTMEALVAWSS